MALTSNINRDDCIGNSRIVINENFRSLDGAVDALSVSLNNALSRLSNIENTNLPFFSFDKNNSATIVHRARIVRTFKDGLTPITRNFQLPSNTIPEKADTVLLLVRANFNIFADRGQQLRFTAQGVPGVKVFGFDPESGTGNQNEAEGFVTFPLCFRNTVDSANTTISYEVVDLASTNPVNTAPDAKKKGVFNIIVYVLGYTGTKKVSEF